MEHLGHILHIDKETVEAIKTWHNKERYIRSSYAILLQANPELDSHECGPSDLCQMVFQKPGAVVETKERKRGMIIVRHLGTVTVGKKGKTTKAVARIPSRYDSGRSRVVCRLARVRKIAVGIVLELTNSVMH